MKAVVQRVRSARVSVEGHVVGEIDAGVLVYVGVAKADSYDQVVWLADKIAGVRIFDQSEQQKTSLSLQEFGGAALVISQFTLMADVRKGRRPSFSSAAPPDHAQSLYDAFIGELAGKIIVQRGVFGADMQVESVNDGPFTLLLEHPF